MFNIMSEQYGGAVARAMKTLTKAKKDELKAKKEIVKAKVAVRKAAKDIKKMRGGGKYYVIWGKPTWLTSGIRNYFYDRKTAEDTMRRLGLNGSVIQKNQPYNFS